MRVIVDDNVFYFEKVDRTWKERLFGVPWNPFRKYNEIKKPGCYRIGDTILVHPLIWDEIKKEIESQKWNFVMPFGVGMGLVNNYPSIFPFGGIS